MSDKWVPSVADRHNQEQVRSFYEKGVWRNEVLSDLLDKWSAKWPEKVVFSDGRNTLTYADFRGQAYRLAAALRRLGVEAGDRVLVQLPNWCEFAITYAALARIGAVMVPVGMVYRHDEITYITNHSGAKGIVATGTFRTFDHLAMIRQTRPQCPTVEFVLVARGEAGSDERAFTELSQPEAGVASSAQLRHLTRATSASLRPGPNRVQRAATTRSTHFERRWNFLRRRLGRPKTMSHSWPRL
jgi:cyclohexanecarboxylate-CoA ligase/acyl-CoA synthetase